MKKLLIVFLMLTCLLNLCACYDNSDEVIGTISGAENEYIIIDNITYVKDDFNSFNSKDRGEYLGRVTNDKISMNVYKVKGDDSGNYIYALWDWEGNFYIQHK